MFVRLFRDSFETPWGFRLQGGKDIGHPLTVQRVFSNSPAEGELQRGDVILTINGRDADTLTHKQALDNIKFGGGQIELKIHRPGPGSGAVTHIHPSSPTRAPQISPTKGTPLKFPVRRSSDQGSRNMPPPAFAGHQPRKITMNKFGGGTSNFGTNYGARAQEPGWRPQPSPYSEQYTPQPSMQQQDYVDSYRAPQPFQPQQFSPPQQQQQQYQPPSPQPQNQPPPQQEPYIPKYQSPGLSQPDYVRSEDPLEEEVYDYVPVSQRKQQFADKKTAPAGEYYIPDEDEAYYPNCPVWERRKMFMRDQPKAMKPRRNKPWTPSTASYASFGTDYSKQQPSPPVQQQRPRPPPVVEPPVNAAPVEVMVDEPDYSSSASVWSGTLRSSGGPKPWEVENAAGEYIMPAQRQAMQYSAPPRPKPAVSPKPTRPQPAAPPAPAPVSPQQKQIIVRSVPNDAGDIQDGPRAVHLQYNSPMGLYSNANVQEAYSVQTKGQDMDPTSSTVSQPKPSQPGIAHAGRFDCLNVVYAKEMQISNPRSRSGATDFNHRTPVTSNISANVPSVQLPNKHYEPPNQPIDSTANALGMSEHETQNKELDSTIHSDIKSNLSDVFPSDIGTEQEKSPNQEQQSHQDTAQPESTTQGQGPAESSSKQTPESTKDVENTSVPQPSVESKPEQSEKLETKKEEKQEETQSSNSPAPSSNEEPSKGKPECEGSDPQTSDYKDATGDPQTSDNKVATGESTSDQSGSETSGNLKAEASDEQAKEGDTKEREQDQGPTDEKGPEQPETSVDQNDQPKTGEIEGRKGDEPKTETTAEDSVSSEMPVEVAKEESEGKDTKAKEEETSASKEDDTLTKETSGDVDGKENEDNDRSQTTESEAKAEQQNQPENPVAESEAAGKQPDEAEQQKADVKSADQPSDPIPEDPKP